MSAISIRLTAESVAAIAHGRCATSTLAQEIARKTQAVAATHTLDNSKIISYLHSGVTLNTVQGPVKFDSKGENGAAAAFVFQWQKGNQVQVLPVGASGSKPATYPKPNWGS